MKTLQDIVQTLQPQKPLLAKKHGIMMLGVFGSYVRGEQTSKSDVDILIELIKPIQLSLLTFIGIENYLSDLLDVQVDLVIKEDLKPRIGEYILYEVIPV